MASAVNSTSSSAATASTPTAAATSALSAPTESMFLNLLVAQIQNQDPLNPSDSTQFVSQLAQFSELEQVIGIRSDTDTLASSASSSTAAASSATSANTATTTTTNSTTSN